MTRVLAVDPSNLSGGDPLAVVMCQTRRTATDVLAGRKRIEILGCKAWKRGDFTEVESEIAGIYRAQKCELLVIEVNSMGQRMAHSFAHEHNLPLRKIHTSAALKEKKAGTMDKMEHTNWLIKFNQAGLLDWPEPTNDHMKELQRQWNVWGEYSRGKMAAPPNDHDDLMMALLLGTFVLRRRELSGTLKIICAENRDRPDYPHNTVGSRGRATLEALNREREEGRTGIEWRQVR